MENNLFQYLKINNSIICRYPLGPDKQAYHIIGEIYDNKDNTWVKKSSTMRYKMSGEGTVISEKQAFNIIKNIK